MNRILSVSELTSQIKTTLSNIFTNIYVEGEISNIINHQSGHSYFNLKDENSSIRCVIFKSNKANINFALEQGSKVTIEGNISVYPPRGEYQILCNNIKKSGIGNLTLNYEILKNKLKDKGYFDSKYKKQLPLFPKKIAFITSKSGAVVHDMLMVTKKRWTMVEITLIDTIVQGDEAKYTIANNIKFADSMGFDIIIIARGGGSLEDLWAFNEEIVATSIFNAKTPIVSAIGHEVDYVLSDFVADLRAPTPSACMEIILPDKEEYLIRLSDMLDNLNILQKNNLVRMKNNLEYIKTKLNLHKFDFEMKNKQLKELKYMIDIIINNIISQKQQYILNKRLILTQTFKLILPSKKAYLEKEYININHLIQKHIQNKYSLLITKDVLDRMITIILNNKNKIIENINNILEIKNKSLICKDGYVQITIDGKIVNIESLNKGDTITISNGVISKDALITTA